MRLVFLLFIICLGCGTAQTTTTRTPLYKYRADIQITAQGKSIKGLISIPRSVPTRIQVDSPVKMDLVRISSCNRDTVAEKIAGAGWFNQVGTQFVYDYRPTDVEHEGFCPLYIQIFDDKLMTAWGFVGFRTTEKLKAKVSCDGSQYEAEGIDACQSFYSFEQGLEFESPIKFVTRGPCAVVKKAENILRVRTTEPGFCLVTAYDGKYFFKFILLGYEQLLVRGRAEPIPSNFSGGVW